MKIVQKIKSKITLFAQFFTYWGWILRAIKNGKRFPIDEAYLSGSRKSAKTKAIANFIVSLNTCETKTRVFILMKTYRGLIEGVWGEIKTAVEVLNQEVLSSTQKPMVIKLSNVDIHFMNLYNKNDSKANLKGLAGNERYDNVVVWVEEADQISQQDWASIGEAVRGCDNTMFITSSNPLRKSHWLFQFMNGIYPFNLNKIKQDKNMMKVINSKEYGRLLIHYSTMYGNDLLPPEELAKSERRVIHRPPGLRDTVLWGAPGQEEGLIYADYMVRISQSATKQAAYLQGGVDFGYTRDATAGIIYGVDGKRTKRMVVREFYHDNALDAYGGGDRQAEDLVRFFVESYKELRKTNYLTTVLPMNVYCESADLVMINQLNKELQNNNAYANIRHLITFYPVNKHKVKINERIDKVRFEMAENILEIDFDKCPRLVRELDDAKWSDKENSIEAKRNDGNDHVLNALEYGIIMDWEIGNT